jgi:hypothetical protein
MGTYRQADKEADVQTLAEELFDMRRSHAKLEASIVSHVAELRALESVLHALLVNLSQSESKSKFDLGVNIDWRT